MFRPRNNTNEHEKYLVKIRAVSWVKINFVEEVKTIKQFRNNFVR